MKTPFTAEQFLEIFEKYNAAVFPVQIILIAAGILSLFLLVTAVKKAAVFAGIFTGTLWIWSGTVYHILFFREINPAATGFGVLFILQGLFLIYETTLRGRIKIDSLKNNRSRIGLMVVLFGLVIYPLISLATKGSLLTSITPGLPCPTLLCTFGLLLIADRNFPKYIMIIPVLWAILGISAVINLGIIQDISLPLAALTVLAWSRRNNPRAQMIITGRNS